MDIREYYNYQAQARGITTLQNVIDAAQTNARLYNAHILPWLPSDHAARIYEVACGPGILLTWLKTKGYRNILGSDSSPVQVELALDAGLPVILADSIRELRQTRSSSLDCIIGLDFYEHLSKEDFLDFLAESSRTLRSGGRLILKGPNGDSPVIGRSLYNDITHVTAYTTIAFAAILKMSGFCDIEFHDDTFASIQKHRWLRVPLAWCAQHILRTLIRLATRENIRCLSASIFLSARRL